MEKLRPCGLKNITGRACSLNTALQALRYSTDSELKCSHNPPEAKCLTCNIDSLFTNMQNSSLEFLEPTQVLEVFDSIKFYTDQDSSEVFVDLLQKLEEDERERKFCKLLEKRDLEDALWESQEHVTHIQELFEGQIRDCGGCPSCQPDECLVTTFKRLELPPAARPTALESLLSEKLFTFKGDCSVCKSKFEYGQQLLQLPKVICFEISRFEGDLRSSKPISIPSTLDLHPHIVNRTTECCVYNLLGAMQHYGSTSETGHHVYVANMGENVSCVLSDQQVSYSSVDKISSLNTYVAFYAKAVDQSSTSVTEGGKQQMEDLKQDVTAKKVGPLGDKQTLAGQSNQVKKQRVEEKHKKCLKRKHEHALDEEHESPPSKRLKLRF